VKVKNLIRHFNSESSRNQVIWFPKYNSSSQAVWNSGLKLSRAVFVMRVQTMRVTFSANITNAAVSFLSASLDTAQDLMTCGEKKQQ
jgi:hypothetical protein